MTTSHAPTYRASPDHSRLIATPCNCATANPGHTTTKKEQGA